MSEWQEEKDRFGGIRRYRMIGGVKEYEMMVTVDGIQIPQSEIEDYHRRKKEAEEAREAARRAVPPPPPPRNCPFKDGLQTRCTGEKCAIYDGAGCALAQISATAARDTSGRKCPFNLYPCDAHCALYKSGCIITALNTKGRKDNE